ncbi:putative RING-type domain-containing protein [Seiridium unicorne]|uniref:RING-type domain-containing protein n=1 Tax=Seiridium unicorne TaxID=138068 RepID=A0ABR2VEZ2_9PEZI
MAESQTNAGTTTVMEAGERTARPNRGRFGRHRGGRGGRGRGGRAQAATPNSQAQPVTGTTASASTSSLGGDVPTPQNSQSGRGSRRSRNARRGGANAGQRTTFGAQRTFGGQLTTDQQAEGQEGEEETRVPGLRVEAKAFVPGQPTHNSRNAAEAVVPKGKAQHVRRGSKSVAPDLPTRIHEDITYGQYECVICTNEVLVNSRIWSCSICWTVSHMSCVRKWYTNQMKKPEQPGAQAPSGWRCPGCNSSMTEEPSTYHCWCGKEVNPNPGQLVLTRAARWFAMQDHVRLVRRWGLAYRAFVESMFPRNVAARQITPMAGVARRSAETFFPAENMNAPAPVIRGYVAVVRYQYPHFATAAKNSKRFPASNAETELPHSTTGS